MFIADTIIKHHLKDVFFVCGEACAGKTTVTKYLAKKYDMILYNWDEQISEYQNLINHIDQPAMSRQKDFASWEEFFMRPVEEYSAWLEASIEEQTDMAIADLIRLMGGTHGRKVLVDGFFSVEILKKISTYHHVVFLLTTEDVVRKDYFNREDTQGMLRCIMGLQNPTQAMENVFQTLMHKKEEKEKEIRDSGFTYFVRETTPSDPRELIENVAKHFALQE